MFIKFRSLCVRGVGQSMLLNPTMCTWHYLYLPKYYWKYKEVQILCSASAVLHLCYSYSST